MGDHEVHLDFISGFILEGSFQAIPLKKLKHFAII